MSFWCAQAQDLTLKGQIISEDLEVLPEVKITDSRNNLLGVTDIEGRFEISIPNGIQRLNISSLGMEPTTIELSNKCDYLEVIVMIEAHYDFMSLKKIDRLRMKRYNKLPELHKEAFEKGIFKTDKAVIHKLYPSMVSNFHLNRCVVLLMEWKAFIIMLNYN